MDGTWENAAHQSSLGNIIIADRDTQQSINRNRHGNQEKEEERSSWSAKVEPKAQAVALQTICVVIIWSIISPGDVFSIQKSVIVVMGEYNAAVDTNDHRFNKTVQELFPGIRQLIFINQS